MSLAIVLSRVRRLVHSIARCQGGFKLEFEFGYPIGEVRPLFVRQSGSHIFWSGEPSMVFV